jgi:tetratricopeptide (TPR) repeat protein
MAFASFQKLAEQQPRFRAAAIDALQMLKRDFPDHEYAKRADYFINKLNRPGVSPEETIADLEKIRPDAAAYLSARYDICLLTHQLWREAGGDDRPALARRVVDAVDRYVRAAGTNADASARLKCHLLVADIALSSTPADIALAEKVLGQAAPLAARVSDQSSASAEYHYRGLQLAGKTGNDLPRREHAAWLIRNAAGSAYELPALVVAATAIDKSLEAAPESRKAELRTEALRIYERLVQRQGDSPDVIRAKKNARVALSRLAGYAYDAGQFAAAAEWLEKLLAALPANQSYLRRAGLAHFQNGNFDRALEHWRSLLAGVPKNSDEWFEAKYYQLCCLRKTDPATAERVLKQYRLLHPDLGPDPWREKFSELTEQD